MTARLHIVGGGLAGLAAAIAGVERGWAVRIYEAAPGFGGRCRAIDDPVLACRIDTGSHLALSCNTAVLDHAAVIGASERLWHAPAARFRMEDLDSGTGWVLDLGAGRLPLWLVQPDRRTPGLSALDHLGLVWRIARAARRNLPLGTLYPPPRRPQHSLALDRLLAPLTLALLNTPVREASARLLWTVLRQSMLAGGAACRPVLPHTTWDDALIQPALTWLTRVGAALLPGTPVLAMEMVPDQRGHPRVRRLATRTGPVDLAPGDAVILACPAWAAQRLLPGLSAPNRHQAILNLHFRWTNLMQGQTPLPIGVIGGRSQWIFRRPQTIAVTIGNPDAETLALEEDQLLTEVWAEVRQTLGLGALPRPAARVIQEKRATFAATPGQDSLRPHPGATGIANLRLAGDWTATGLPSTMEGALRSGRSAVNDLPMQIPA